MATKYLRIGKTGKPDGLAAYLIAERGGTALYNVHFREGERATTKKFMTCSVARFRRMFVPAKRAAGVI